MHRAGVAATSPSRGRRRPASGLRARAVTAAGLLALSLGGAHAAAPAEPAASAATLASPAPAPADAGPSGAGQRIYERTRPQLLQVRTLLRTQDSQSSVGSGFLVDDGGLLVTNYHVVSQYALQPERHRLVYATVDGVQAAAMAPARLLRGRARG